VFGEGKHAETRRFVLRCGSAAGYAQRNRQQRNPPENTME
jgi:hypothetical protein